jgi:hypothetical protein
MKKRELEKMDPADKKAMRKAAAKIMGDKIIHEKKIRKSEEKEEESTE